MLNHLNEHTFVELINPWCRFGPRYFPIVNAYSRNWREKAEKVGKEMGECVHQGVYAVVGGPNFESVAEVKMLRMMGADVVGKC